MDDSFVAMRILLALFLVLNLSSCAYYFGNRWQRSFKKIESSAYPRFETRPQRIPNNQLSEHPLVLEWADKDLVRPTKKDQRGPERLLFAKLMAKKEVEAVNAYLLESVPWGNSGTSGALNPKGDYDFTTVILAAILYEFENDTALLWPQTAEHIAKVLLVEEGGKPHTKTPRTMRIMKDTENHILMTNISQYFKNQWMREHGDTDEKYDNLNNGLERFLIENLEELQRTGQYEFNSKPYEGYTVAALLILYSYCHSQALKQKAAETLDMMCWEYMQSSYKFRKSAPFRRRLERFKSTSLSDNAMTSMMRTWYLEAQNGEFDLNWITHNHHHALAALVNHYRPPAAIWDEDRSEALVLIGHGHQSSPEIHSRGPGFMLSAGGFQRGEASQIVARPIVLILNDTTDDIQDCFHIEGHGKWSKWNNTGVHHRLAVGRSHVEVPAQYTAIDSLGNWRKFQAAETTVICYSTESIGLIYLPKTSTSLEELARLNPEPSSGTFHSTEGNIFKFDLKAYKGTWVMSQADGKPLNRKTDHWKRVVVEKLD